MVPLYFVAKYAPFAYNVAMEIISNFFHTALYQPFYNGLVFLINIMPYADVGFAVIALTLIVKFVIFPFTHKGVKTQAKMRQIEPEIKEIKEKHKKDRQQQAMKTMELYREHGINPFAGCSMLLIQLPVIIALYWVFWKGLTNGIDASILYTFVSEPESMNMNFLGFIDMAGKSMLLALIAGVTQYFQINLSMPPSKDGDGIKDMFKKISSGNAGAGPPSFKDEFAKSFKFQMRYGFPVIVFFVAYTISTAVALYWATSNIFSIVHELLVRRKANRDANPQM
jgi:YidC/Oxa1 family membrane protein insertase